MNKFKTYLQLIYMLVNKLSLPSTVIYKVAFWRNISYTRERVSSGYQHTETFAEIFRKTSRCLDTLMERAFECVSYGISNEF